MPVLELSDLTKDYTSGFWGQHRRRALDHLSLSVTEGEVFGLLGPNGAGKTTTLKLVFRLIYPTAGQVRIFDKPWTDIESHRRLGYLPEAPYFYDYLTAREFLNYCAQLSAVKRSDRQRRVAQLLERVGLANAADVALRHFSRGMLQRVGIAQALIHDPDLVFLDEPMLGLDPVGRREVRDLILELRARGKTVCFSTHVLADAETLCDRVAILNQGRLHGLGTLDEILSLRGNSSEVMLASPSAELVAALRPLADGVRTAGDKLHILVPETKLFELINCVRQKGGRLLSVNPVRMSLEDYFYEEFGTEREPELLEKK